MRNEHIPIIRHALENDAMLDDDVRQRVLARLPEYDEALAEVLESPDKFRDAGSMEEPDLKFVDDVVDDDDWEELAKHFRTRFKPDLSLEGQGYVALVRTKS